MGVAEPPSLQEAIEVAIEHCLWAAREGFAPGDVLTSLGVDWPNGSVTTDTAIIAVALAWRHLYQTNPNLRQRGQHRG